MKSRIITSEIEFVQLIPSTTSIPLEKTPMKLKMKSTIPKTSRILSGVAVSFLLAAASSNAATIYSQSFGGTSTTLLDTTVVQTGIGSWVAGSTFTTSGNLIGTARRTSAVLAFNPVQGEIYELTATVTLTNAGFIGLGFADKINFTGNTGSMNDNNAFRFATTSHIAGYSWMFQTSAAETAYSGAGLSGSSGTATATGSVALKVVLDASNITDWVTTYYVNGTSIGTSTASAAALDAAIDSVGFTSGNGLGTIRDFTLATVPEPGAALLGSIGVLGLLRRRRN